MTKFSVLMSVYKNDVPENVKKALDSVIFQTVKPDEIIMTIDGPVSDEIHSVLNEFKSLNKELVLIPLEKNVGLGNALNIGLSHCNNEIIARMDSDDICYPNRFELQLKAIQESDLDIVGGYVAEFCDDENDIISIRKVPETQADIAKMIKKRSPFNHPSVMFKKSKVQEVGNYIELHYLEDYYLWCRMFIAGAQMGNIAEPILRFRMNKDTFRRRGGYKYFKSFKVLFKFMYKNKIINKFEYLQNILIRFVGHVLISGKLREKLYKKRLRK